MMPITLQHHARLSTNCAVAAFAAGRATRQETLDRIDAALERIAHLPVRAVAYVIEGHRRLITGDVAGSLDARTKAAEVWHASHQHAFEHALRLRIHELRGDRDAAARSAAELKRLGIGDPDRYATAQVGPNPTR